MDGGCCSSCCTTNYTTLFSNLSRRIDYHWHSAWWNSNRYTQGFLVEKTTKTKACILTLVQPPRPHGVWDFVSPEPFFFFGTETSKIDFRNQSLTSKVKFCFCGFNISTWIARINQSEPRIAKLAKIDCSKSIFDFFASETGLLGLLGLQRLTFRSQVLQRLTLEVNLWLFYVPNPSNPSNIFWF